MGQFLPEVRGVFELIERHKKSLEEAVQESVKRSNDDRKTKSADSDVNKR